MLPWAEYRAEPWRPEPRWCIETTPGGRTNPPIISIVAVDSDKRRRSFSLGGWRAWYLLPFRELPALVEFAALVPAARSGFARPDVARELVSALASTGWRKPKPPSRTLTVNGYDVPIAAALKRRAWFVGDRLVDGTPEPAVETIVDDLTQAAPHWAHLDSAHERVAKQVVRMCATGRWPDPA